MRTRILLLVAILALSLSAMAQTAVKRQALPANLLKYVNEYPVELLKIPSVKSRLRTLLGKRYADFDRSIQVQAPMEKVGDFLFGSGCLPHSCTINEAAFAIDIKNKRIHAVIYDSEMPPRYFNEDKAPTPKVLLDWIAEFGQ